jgi:hypothetical protein
MQDITIEHPIKRNMVIQISMTESWPFPYVLAWFPKVNYWNVKQQFFPEAGVIMLDQKDFAGIEERLKANGFSYFDLKVRDSRDPIKFAYKKEIFADRFAPLEVKHD